MHRYTHLPLLLILLLVASNTSTAQSPLTKTNTTNSNNPSIPKPNISPSTSVIIIILISAFVFLAFFSIYFRQYVATNPTSSSTHIRARPIQRMHGLDPEILSTFPTLIYSQVKEHKLSKSALECAICLNEFDDDETLRLLPNCSHAFHTDCIDAWLAAHITCPVCRYNLTEPVENKEVHVVVEIGDDEERKREMHELEEFVNTKRGRYFRSYTTGHARSTAVQSTEEDLERYTLRLPENVRNVIMLRRASSCVVFTHEESEKKGFTATEKLGSFLKRSLTMKNGGKRPKSSSFRHVISTFDCCPGGGGSSSSSIDSTQLNKDKKSSVPDS